MERIKDKIKQLDLRNTEKVRRTVNSYLGILSHTASYHIRQDLLLVA